MESSTHHDVNAMERSTHHDVNAMESSTHHDVNTMESSTHHDVNAMESSTHHDVNAMESSTHHDVNTMESSRHHDVNAMESSRHHDSNAMESSTHHDVNAKESSTHHDVNAMESSRHHDSNAMESSTHHDVNAMESSTHHDVNAMESSRHHDVNTMESSRHHDSNAMESLTHHDVNTMESSTHRDLNAMESSTHHDVNAMESSTHHDVNTMESSRHHDVNTMESSTHHDVNTMESSTHRDVNVMESSTHHDVNTMESSTHHDVNTMESSTHRDVNVMESSTHPDVNAMESSTHHDFNAMVSSFPCLFNKTPLFVGQNMREIEFKLENELSEDNDSPEEIIAKLNFYTWVEFKLGNFPMANQYNQKVFSYLEARERPNITCLVNKAHILHSLGDDMQAEQCLAKAGELRSGCDGEKLMTEVDAELAYSLSRLSGAENLNRAIELYTEVVAKQPECYAWILRLGLLHRRATRRNVFSFLASNKSTIEHAEKAVELLYVVAQKSSDSYLRGRAYAQLAVLRSQSNRCFGQADCVRLFGEANVPHFIDNALNHGRNDAWTLTECGRIMRYTDLEKAISLLVQSLLMKNHSTTLHHLGMCYELNAKKIARRASREERKYIRESPISTQSKHQYQPNTSKQSYSGLPGSSENKTPVSSAIRSQVKSKNLNKGDPSVFLAIKCYCEAIVFSSDRNSAARFSLGLLLKECGEFEEALEHFDRIIDMASKDNEQSCEGRCEHLEYRDTLKAAYKQARLCLLELAKQPGKTEDGVKQLQERAEEKRLKAVSLEADMTCFESKRKRCK